MPDARERRLPVGAEVLPRGVHFRVWAPLRTGVQVVFDDASAPELGLTPEPEGYFCGISAVAKAGMRYRYRLDGGEAFPDPATRYQPEGPHGPSEIVDPAAFTWTDTDWKGVALRGQVIYEMHTGTFTREGTFAAARQQLVDLARLGITLIELMPIAEFPGRFGWGYDGVHLFAPSHLYGDPCDLRRFIDEAHRAGIGVILDVVYNHFGPEGNYTGEFSKAYTTSRHETDWGDAINFDGENSGPVREFVIANAGYWITEYHFDGLRLDATQNIYDSSSEHILAAITRRVREAAAGRETVVIAENESQEIQLVQPCERGGYGLDGLWNDDFHHSAMVALTGRNEAYYTDYLGTPQEFISAVKYGFLYQGQWYKWQAHRRGTAALDVDPARFVVFIQNHDQVANSARGERCHMLTSPGRYKAMTALMLLAPGTPMLFQGQEFAASTPFFFFADLQQCLTQLVRQGRVAFLEQWESHRTPEMQASFIDPCSEDAFERSKLDLAERETNPHIFALHRDLIRLRREDPVFSHVSAARVDGAVLGPEAFVLRWIAGDHDDRLLLVNLGRSINLNPSPEPLLAPPAGMLWQVLWSTEDTAYRGIGIPPIETERNWIVPAHAAVVLKGTAAERKVRSTPLLKGARNA